MKSYKHLTIDQRESLWLMKTNGISLRKIAQHLNVSHSTLSRELKRNSSSRSIYRPSKAQHQYITRRKKCKRHKLLENPVLRDKIKHYITDKQWSPEEIAGRLKLEENIYQVSYTTIYRAIYSRLFEEKDYKKGTKGFKVHLRKHGKPRKSAEHKEVRGQLKVTNPIETRPKAANERSEVGHFELDTIAGKRSTGYVLIFVDRKTRYTLATKVETLNSKQISRASIRLLQELPKGVLKTITTDRGKEFSAHEQVTAALAVPYYFANPHAPWEKPTVENTNGLIREYMPKRKTFENYDDAYINDMVDKLNKRPRKCLHWRTPFESFFHSMVHLT